MRKIYIIRLFFLGILCGVGLWATVTEAREQSLPVRMQQTTQELGEALLRLEDIKSASSVESSELLYVSGRLAALSERLQEQADAMKILALQQNSSASVSP